MPPSNYPNNQPNYTGAVIGIVILALIGAGALVFFFTRSGEPADQGGSNATGSGSTQNGSYMNNTYQQGVSGQGDQQVEVAYVASRNGSPLPVREFSDNPEYGADSVNTNISYLGSHFEAGAEGQAAGDPPYVIEYMEKTDHFSIAILKEPIKENRIQAEEYLRSKLGIPKMYMCRLRYTLSVPVRVNPVYAGQNLGFSFCPGAAELP